MVCKSLQYVDTDMETRRVRAFVVQPAGLVIVSVFAETDSL